MCLTKILHRISHPKLLLSTALFVVVLIIIAKLINAISVELFVTLVTLVFVAVTFATNFNSSQAGIFVNLISQQSRIYDILHQKQKLSNSEEEEILNYFESLGYLARTWKIDPLDAANLFGDQAITVYGKFKDKNLKSYTNFEWFVDFVKRHPSDTDLRNKTRSIRGKSENDVNKFHFRAGLFSGLFALVVILSFLVYWFVKTYSTPSLADQFTPYMLDIYKGAIGGIIVLIGQRIFKGVIVEEK